MLLYQPRDIFKQCFNLHNSYIYICNNTHTHMEIQPMVLTERMRFSSMKKMREEAGQVRWSGQKMKREAGRKGWWGRRGRGRREECS